MSIYEEVEIEDMLFDEEKLVYTYPCPCGDRFKISLEDLWDGEDVAKCPSCTLRIVVIYEEEDLPPLPDDDEDDESSEGEQVEKEEDGDAEEEEEDDEEELTERLHALAVKS